MATPADLVLCEKNNIGRALKAISEGYKVEGLQDRYIVVENPDFVEGENQDPNFVIDTFPIIALLRVLGGNL